MHGLMFETSIWLLAGSTRLLQHNKWPLLSKCCGSLLKYQVISCWQLLTQSAQTFFVINIDTKYPSNCTQIVHVTCHVSPAFKHLTSCKLVDDVGVSRQKTRQPSTPAAFAANILARPAAIKNYRNTNANYSTNKSPEFAKLGFWQSDKLMMYFLCFLFLAILFFVLLSVLAVDLSAQLAH